MRGTIISAAIAAAMLGAPAASAQSEPDLQKRVDQLAAELEKVKAELAQQRARTAAPPAAPAPAVPAAETAPATVLTAYGEINYNYLVRRARDSQADVRRFVIGLHHRFDERTRLVSEIEWEHAVVSAEDSGETVVEQLYIERDFANGLRGKAGLILIPAGFLNQVHEPTNYYGVERNFVETAIIPTTWREIGVALSGELGEGFTWDAGVTTSFDLTEWDPASNDGRTSPLGSIKQSGERARARDVAVHGALNWRGMPGLLVGGSVFSGKAGHQATDFPGDDARVTLWDLHARYTPGPWDLSALYARGLISSTAALNATFAGNPTPVPRSFLGWYLQAAYRLYQWSDYRLSPFVRYESFNTARRYSQPPAVLGVVRSPYERVATLGANLWIGQGVVVKADYQKFDEDDTRDRINLGIGFSY